MILEIRHVKTCDCEVCGVHVPLEQYEVSMTTYGMTLCPKHYVQMREKYIRRARRIEEFLNS